MKKNNTTRKQLVVVIKKTRSFAKKTEITTQSRQNTTAANSTAANYPNTPSSAGSDNIHLSAPEPGQSGAPATAAGQPTPPAAPPVTTVPPLPKFNPPRAETTTPPSAPPAQPSTPSAPQPSLPSPSPAPVAAASAAEPPTAQEPATPPFAPDYAAVGNQLSKLMSGMAAPLSRLAGSFQSFAHATNQSLLKPAQSVAPKTEPKPVTPAPTSAKPISLPTAPAQKISVPVPSGKTGTVQRALATGAAYKQGDIAGLDDAHTRALVASTAATESAGGKLDIRNSAGYLGRYQAGASWLADAGLIAGGANAVIAAMKADGFTNEYKWGKSGGMTRFLKNKNNWKNGLDYDKYLSSAEVQDTAFKTNSDKAYKQLLKEGTIKPNMSQDEIAGILKARHIGGIGGARKAAKGIEGAKDANGTSALKYKNDLAAGNVFIESYQPITPKKEDIIDTSSNNESPPKREFSYKKYDYALTDALNKQMALDGSSKATYGNYGAVTRSTVKGYMDPQKNMNETSIYQFLDLTTSAELPEKTIKEALQGKGELSGKEKVFINAAKKYGINEAYLVAHALVETDLGRSPFATGKHTKNGKSIYNMYGISVFPKNPKPGIELAYKEKWLSVDEAIDGGAKWISRNYINREKGQNTLYNMRWNPQKPATHQYATAINWATDQSIHMKKMMDTFPNAKLKFEIPEYNK
ncbi:glucosaminidase domain-containing protein [Dickeya dadantii]|uniref:N-acetylglucosaminidase n=1 Tax=Dickeya dadantii TaxID=204038 RepID=UPI001CF4AB91|nr:glucosaminidase domain-containing protein [Dickeya dadantii]MCA7012971.1 glucosaminidase domain-containing protein [Dickeya dadantii]